MTLRDRRDIETDVYQPAEDSQLLADVVCERLAADPDDAILEVGTGSGYVAGRISEVTDARVVASDLNPHAVRQARGEGVESVRADLVSPFANDAFDVVAFNPPYLPTDPENEWDDWMERALSGGEDGRAVIDPFLERVGRVLAPDGVVYLLVSSLTGVDEVAERAGEAGFSAVAVADESFPFETLTVLELFE
ncbi:HemK2/MTQ2 family protein methyltransferase [Natrarchaeobaculum sulfurireducens]|uniref:Methylase of polypeptide chain release factors n=1 Tax=Natrarchaeobaculum sulfurireducens TaxID=2044521 RepID=A0A346PT39_9EURY|nr:HemK2/MTQ2 family protein methyltransferase [Natrarchaeobaculum sulfurireducens]AXR77353.1 Methylase of polypeptide chain release factors [Natrarchaeobaculum sulfurireducens]AXR82684.1 Protein-N(5)-glutamine methyltransferase PrmC,methylates polypeptide chain release factors RF1 and RF2 [Natrarchaeobaculum sulfurireducens]